MTVPSPPRPERRPPRARQGPAPCPRRASGHRPPPEGPTAPVAWPPRVPPPRSGASREGTARTGRRGRRRRVPVRASPPGRAADWRRGGGHAPRPGSPVARPAFERLARASRSAHRNLGSSRSALAHLRRASDADPGTDEVATCEISRRIAMVALDEGLYELAAETLDEARPPRGERQGRFHVDELPPSSRRAAGASRRPRPRNRATRRPPPALPGSPPGWSTALSSRRMPSATSSRSRPPRRPPVANGLREIPVAPLSTLARAMEGEDHEILAVAGCDDRVVE